MKEKKESEDEDSDEIEIDFSKVTNFFSKIKKKLHAKEDKVEEKIIKEEKKEEHLKDKREEIERKEEAAEERIEKLEEKEDKIEEEIEKEKEKIVELEEKKEKIEEKEREVERAEDEMEEKEDEIELDFSKIKQRVMGLFRKEKGPGKEKAAKDEEEDISIDVKKTASDISQFSRKHATLLLLLIPIILSIWFRSYPLTLPITDDWAESTVHNMLRNNIGAEINSQYPNLPDRQKNELIQKQFNDVLSQNKDAIKQQIEGTSQYFKSRLQDEDGNTYLLAIDPYFWHTYAKNKLETGKYHDDVNEDGEKVFSLRNGRFGRVIDPAMLNPELGLWLYRFLHFFNGSTTLAGAMFLLPMLLVTLAVIPAFFIGKKIAGEIGGVFAGTILAINSSLLSRTPAGFADTDAYNVLFPLMIAWAVLAALDEKEAKRKIIYSALGGLAVGLYSYAWLGSSYMFVIIIASLGIYFLANLGLHRKEIMQDPKKAYTMPLQKNILIVAASLIVSSGIFVTFFRGFSVFIGSFTAPIRFITLKQVAVTTIWPNVLTTVAEFNTIPLSGIISQMGGNLLFLIAIIGILLSIIEWKKERWGRWGIYPILLVIWFIATSYSFTKGMRFAVLIVPSFAIAFGAGLGMIYSYVIKYTSKELNIKKNIGGPVLIVLFCLLLLSPLNSAASVSLHEVPSMNDAWHASLTAVRDNSTDAIITSWWDFGHWFISASERRVTFDGADQGRRIHWVGKSLLTASEDENIGILRMMNCGQEYTFDVLDKYINDGAKSIDILNEIIVEDRKTAKKILKFSGLSDEEAEEVLELSHCKDLIPQYYITSDDMIGKAGVWGHFGSWNFTKAAIYNEVKGKKYEDAVKIMAEDYGISEETADTYYYEIQDQDADRWVSAWPGYRSGLVGCSKTGSSIQCGDGIKVNLENKDVELRLSQQSGVSKPESLVYADKDGVHEKTFKNNTIPISVVIMPRGDVYAAILTDPLHANSMFTRLFFFKGHGLKYYELLSYQKSFTGNEIYVWKVDFEPHKPIIMAEFQEKKAPESTNETSQVLSPKNITSNSSLNASQNER